jgi:flagellar basal-body rod modification protein FlgD
METSTITETSTVPAAATAHGFEGLGGDSFFKLLIAQLSNQDPLEPTSNQELLQQISSIRDIELSTSLTNSLRTLTEQQRVGSGAALIGQFVSGDANAGQQSQASSSGFGSPPRARPF